MIGADDDVSPFPPGDRDHRADGRDRVANAQDDQAEARDARSDARDRQAATRESGQAAPDPGAASDRAEAKRDRQDSADDRRNSEDDRDASLADRDHAAHDRATALLDGLTGAHRRVPGLLELQREVTKAHRTGKSLVLAFLDIDGLKTLNDTEGHAAGDDLLLQVVDTLRGVVREYDLIVRYGGDEFVCGLADMGLPEAQRRFEVVNASLAVTRHASVTVGLAELWPGESLDELIGRADASMYAARENDRTG